MKKARGTSRDAIPGLGARVLSRRTELGLSQRDLGSEAQVPYPKISLIEGGGMHAGVSGPTLMKLARALQVSIDWLCGLTDDPTPKHRNGDPRR